MRDFLAYTRQKNLHAEASANGVGQSLSVRGLAVVACQVTGTYSNIVITFQGTIDGLTWVNLRSVRHDGQKIGAVVGNGIYVIPVDGLVEIRANLVFTVGTSVTVIARASSIASGMPTLPGGSASVSASVSPSVSPSSSESASASASVSPSSSESTSASASASSSVSASPSA